MQQVASSPSRNLYPATIRLGRKLGVNRRNAAMYHNGNAYAEDFLAMVVGFSILIPGDGDLPLMPGFAFGAD